MPQPCCNRKDLHRDLLQAGNYLRWWVNKPEHALELMRRYGNCPCIEGVEEAKYRRIIGLVYSMTGDCYRAMNQFDTAAEWYEKAALQSDFTGGGPIYANMVIKRKLSRHYATALQAVRANIAWENQDFDGTAKTKYATVVLRRGVWLEPDFWLAMARKPTLLQRLENLVAMQERGEID